MTLKLTMLKHFSKTALVIVMTALTLTACIPMMDNGNSNDGSYDMQIFEISNPRILDTVTAVDVRVINRGCPPQTLVGATAEQSGSTIEVGIRYKDVEGISACATFDEIHTVNLGPLASGDYLVKARAPSQTSLLITVP